MLGVRKTLSQEAELQLVLLGVKDKTQAGQATDLIKACKSDSMRVHAISNKKRLYMCA